MSDPSDRRTGDETGAARACRGTVLHGESTARPPWSHGGPCLASGGASPLSLRQPGPPPDGQEDHPSGRGRARPRRRGPQLRVRGRRRPVREGRRPPRGPFRKGPRLSARPGVLGRRPAGRPGAAEAEGTGRAVPQCLGLDLRRRRAGARGPRGPDLRRGNPHPELSEKVWGHDLRIEGVVVEPLHGVDDLPSIVREFRPGQGRRLGVLVDHLVRGSKESRIAEQVTGEHALVVGHPFIDIWQAVKPSVVGIRAWPVIPKGQPWKEGVCTALGWEDDTGYVWAQRILARVQTWTDLEPALIGRVEELIDFVTTD